MMMQSIAGAVVLTGLVLTGARQISAPDNLTPGTTALLVEPKGIDDISALRHAIGHTDGRVRLVAARAAGFLGRQDMAQPLLDGLAREQDPDVAAEQVPAVLHVKGLESLTPARAAATRLGGPVLLALAESLARTQPGTFASTLPDLVREAGESQSDILRASSRWAFGKTRQRGQGGNSIKAACAYA